MNFSVFQVAADTPEPLIIPWVVFHVKLGPITIQIQLTSTLHSIDIIQIIAPKLAAFLERGAIKECVLLSYHT